MIISLKKKENSHIGTNRKIKNKFFEIGYHGNKSEWNNIITISFIHFAWTYVKNTWAHNIFEDLVLF